jgi:ferric iron reductase protein FhuF
MLIRLEQPFIESAEKLKDRFSEQDREELSQAIEANYEKIRLIMLEQEKSKDKSKPTLLQLGNIGSRFFGFNIYSNDDVDDVPIAIRELIPTISPVRLDLMTTTEKTKSADPNSTYLKAAQVYDDGSIKAKYYAEAIREDEGFRPP